MPKGGAPQWKQGGEGRWNGQPWHPVKDEAAEQVKKKAGRKRQGRDGARGWAWTCEGCGAYCTQGWCCCSCGQRWQPQPDHRAAQAAREIVNLGLATGQERELLRAKVEGETSGSDYGASRRYVVLKHLPKKVVANDPALYESVQQAEFRSLRAMHSSMGPREYLAAAQARSAELRGKQEQNKKEVEKAREEHDAAHAQHRTLSPPSPGSEAGTQDSASTGGLPAKGTPHFVFSAL